MCYALYACREKLALRHFDIKLLNFFVARGLSIVTDDAQRSALEAEGGATVLLRVGFGEHVFAVPLSASGLSVVKLADFGTSAVGAGGLGNPIDAQQVRQHGTACC